MFMPENKILALHDVEFLKLEKCAYCFALMKLGKYALYLPVVWLGDGPKTAGLWKQLHLAQFPFLPANFVSATSDQFKMRGILSVEVVLAWF